MTLKNCIKCGRLHNNISKYCKECLEEEKRDYKIVKDYLWSHPNATVENIFNETGIERKKIRRYVREDRFIITNGILDDEK